MKVFSSKKECAEYLDKLGMQRTNCGNWWFLPGRYELSHGELDRPDYQPRRYKDGWGVHMETHYFPGTLYAIQLGRVEIDVLNTCFGPEMEIVSAGKGGL